MNRFGSWIYDATELDMVEKVSGNGTDASEYDENCSYRISNSYSQRKAIYYDSCCPEESFVAITITVHFVPRNPMI